MRNVYISDGSNILVKVRSALLTSRGPGNEPSSESWNTEGCPSLAEHVRADSAS